jgi:hypothetical protein
MYLVVAFLVITIFCQLVVAAGPTKLLPPPPKTMLLSGFIQIPYQFDVSLDFVTSPTHLFGKTAGFAQRDRVND